MGSLGKNQAPNRTAAAETIPDLRHRLLGLYEENIAAKILRVAEELLSGNNPPTRYPETVPQSGPEKGRYQSREAEFWTAGYFPGCIYNVLERVIRYPQSFGIENSSSGGNLIPVLRQKLITLGHSWSEPIKKQSSRTDTHDVALAILPHMRLRWELLNDQGALDSIITAANSLASRYNPKVQAIRSWDTFDWHDGVQITSMEDNFLVIIDSMCNLDTLFYAAAQSGNRSLAEIATSHASTLLKSHLREEKISRDGYSGKIYSVNHLINFSPHDGLVKEVRTAQGYAKDSTWTRGQAWGITGYAQTYRWSGDETFLHAAAGLAEYFLYRLETAPEIVETTKNGRQVGRYVPVWDFDAPIDEASGPLRDVSAASLAANGMLILSQAFAGRKQHDLSSRYLDAAIKIVQDVLDFSLSEEKMYLAMSESGEDLVSYDSTPNSRFDAILKHSTVNHNGASAKSNKAADTGLVYADYYLLEFGTRLLEMNIW